MGVWVRLLIRFFSLAFVAFRGGVFSRRSVWSNSAGLINDNVVILTVGLVDVGFGVPRLCDVDRLPVCSGAATLRNGSHVTRP